MKPSNKYIVSVIATGFVVLTTLSILLFWGRKICQGIFYREFIVHKAQVGIYPSGLVPELDKAPEVVRKSHIQANIVDNAANKSLGLVQEIGNLEHGVTGEFCYSWRVTVEGIRHLVLFDETSGLFVYYNVFREARGWAKTVKLYAGPEGIAENTDAELGRFSKPQRQLWQRMSDNSITFFDKSQKQFFRLNFEDKTVSKGPELVGEFYPVRIDRANGIEKNRRACYLGWTPPLRKRTEQDIKDKKKILRSGPGKDKDGNRIEYVSAGEAPMGTYLAEDLLTIDETGEIRKVDSKTLELSGTLGRLPMMAKTGRKSADKLKGLFAYEVQPFVKDGEYAGTIAASISREGTELQVSVFDANGRLINKEGAEADPTEEAGGLLLFTINYLLENLQPAIGGLASYFTANTFEAVAGHRGLFILPNSFVAILNRDSSGIIGPLIGAIIIISPSIILGLALGLRVHKDAGVVGFSMVARRNWLIGTILFGISAYITYRLTRPREVLVTCQNCGKMRRPDMEKCHQCGAAWVVPELAAPSWRVRDERQ